ncbi:hypothetical protein [Streptomyces bobili]|uniref:Uncharacterized protein n=1 Tax=Streptomyces bobili TaxID=67280 RepID=A0ABZ1RAQ9_9ACTN|nr:hypothetical protein [Streptomyces bobili]
MAGVRAQAVDGDEDVQHRLERVLGRELARPDAVTHEFHESRAHLRFLGAHR